MIHEAGHIGGLDHNESTYVNTVMNAGPPTKPASGAPYNGWNYQELRRCDTAGLQLAYGVGSLAGPYADCFDHVPNATTIGLKTRITTSPSTTIACVGEAVTFSGVLEVLVDDTNYDELSGSDLASRLVKLQKSAVNPVVYQDAASTFTSSSSGAYTRLYGSNTAGTWKFRVWRDSEPGLEHSSSAQYTVTWSNAC
jgi:hypothetical protein